MSDSFDFEAFINGLDVNLPRFEVPLYQVVHQSRIDELDGLIKAASDPENVASDERESSTGVTEWTAERDRLVNEQEDSARWLELRALTSQEFASIAWDDKKDTFDQLAAQTVGTRNPMPREAFVKIKETVLPGAFSLFLARANEIVEDTVVMPDFSLSDSRNQRRPESSAN